jgi:hypothetical protein
MHRWTREEKGEIVMGWLRREERGGNVLTYQRVGK